MEIREQEEFTIAITRFLSGDAKPEDEAKLVIWIEMSEINKQYFDQIKNIWEVSSLNSNPTTINTEKALRKVLQRVTTSPKRKNFWNYFKNIAAAALIPLLLGNITWCYLNYQDGSVLSKPIYNEIYTDFGTRTSVVLSDGSTAWLNSGTNFKYPSKFSGKERVVFLEGEAYFEVATNSSNPFIVNTSSLKVRATGTKFNISDFASDTDSEVTLVSGKVDVGGTSVRDRDRPSYELLPGQHLIFSKQVGVSTVYNEDHIYEYFSWKDGKTIFRNKPLSYVVKKVSKIFNVDIEIQGNKLQEYSYRATFEDESLNEILKLLKVSSPIDYTEVKRSQLADGSFTKRKIILYPISK